MIMVRFYFPDLHPKLGASRTRSAYGSVPDPFPSPLKMGKGRQRQTSTGIHRPLKVITSKMVPIK